MPAVTWSSLAGVLVDPSNFEVTKGQDLVKRYESEFAPRHFCSNCGSSLYDDLGEKYFVAAGLMRDLDLEPSFHLQVAYEAKWETIGDSAPQFDENPPAEPTGARIPGRDRLTTSHREDQKRCSLSSLPLRWW